MIRYIIIINIVTFLMYGLDKYLALKEKRRISEKLLLTLALCLGIVGAIAGMKVFKHKTKKGTFKTSIILIIIVQIATIYYMYVNKNVWNEIIKIIGIW